MSVFKKSCFECGAKSTYLYENKCENCFKAENPPIEDIKQIKLSICNMCSRIHYKSGFFTEKKIKEMLPVIVSKNITINTNYILNEIQIKNIETKNNKISFEVEVRCDLKSFEL